VREHDVAAAIAVDVADGDAVSHAVRDVRGTKEASGLELALALPIDFYTLITRVDDDHVVLPVAVEVGDARFERRIVAREALRHFEFVASVEDRDPGVVDSVPSTGDEIVDTVAIDVAGFEGP
jgi:hypothetical protein